MPPAPLYEVERGKKGGEYIYAKGERGKICSSQILLSTFFLR